MDMYESLFSAESVLNEQIARHVFESFGHEGPLMVIVGRDGHSWPSNSERFSEFHMSMDMLASFCSRIDDGGDPLDIVVDGNRIVGCQLSSESVNCGYIFMIIDKQMSEQDNLLVSIMEMVFNMTGLVAKLIERNNRMYEQQARQMSN